MMPHSIGGCLAIAINIYVFILLLDVILSYVTLTGKISSFHPLVQNIRKMTSPVLDPIRKILPPYRTGNLDFSSFIAMFVLQMIASRLWGR